MQSISGIFKTTNEFYDFGHSEVFQGLNFKRLCSKLTTSLVNVSLNFQKLISQTCQYFVEKKVRSCCIAKTASLIFSTKKFSVFGYKVIKHLTS